MTSWKIHLDGGKFCVQSRCVDVWLNVGRRAEFDDFESAKSYVEELERSNLILAEAIYRVDGRWTTNPPEGMDK